MSNYDHLIEAHESAIADLDPYIDYHRIGWGPDAGSWVEWRDYNSGQRARHVNVQAVLFAIREGF